MAFNFPASPTLGQNYTANGITWIYDGTVWNLYVAPSATLADVAITGDYNSLSNRPVLFSGDYNDLTVKPTSFTSLSSLGLSLGATITEFSTDVTLGGATSSNDAVPTELAVKSYIDTQLSTFEGGSIDPELFATVATTGSYNDLIDKPTLFSGGYDDLTGKPALFSGSYDDLTSKPTIPTVINNLTDVDTQTNPPAVGQVLKWNGLRWIPAADATTGGAGTDATTLEGQPGSYYLNYANLTGRPNLDGFAPLNSPAFTGTVTGITAAMVGLGNVDNTSDINKLVSTATQTALDLKAPINNPAFTGTVTGITSLMVGLGNVTNESKATMFASPAFTGTVTGITAAMVGLGNVTDESKATMFASPAFTGTASANRLTLAGSDGTGIPLKLSSGLVANTPEAGAVEYDGVAFYMSADSTLGRSYVPTVSSYRISSNISVTGNNTDIVVFGTAGTEISLNSPAWYQIDYWLVFRVASGTAVTFSLASTTSLPTITAELFGSFGLGSALSVGPVNTATFTATASLSNAVTYSAKVRAVFQTNSPGTRFRLRSRSSANLTVLPGSGYTLLRLPDGNTGTFQP